MAPEWASGSVQAALKGVNDVLVVCSKFASNFLPTRVRALNRMRAERSSGLSTWGTSYAQPRDLEKFHQQRPVKTANQRIMAKMDDTQ
jgi:hypothetical protein